MMARRQIEFLTSSAAVLTVFGAIFTPKVAQAQTNANLEQILGAVKKGTDAAKQQKNNKKTTEPTRQALYANLAVKVDQYGGTWDFLPETGDKAEANKMANLQASEKNYLAGLKSFRDIAGYLAGTEYQGKPLLTEIVNGSDVLNSLITVGAEISNAFGNHRSSDTYKLSQIIQGMRAPFVLANQVNPNMLGRVGKKDFGDLYDKVVVPGASERLFNTPELSAVQRKTALWYLLAVDQIKNTEWLQRDANTQNPYVVTDAELSNTIQSGVITRNGKTYDVKTDAIVLTRMTSFLYSKIYAPGRVVTAQQALNNFEQLKTDYAPIFENYGDVVGGGLKAFEAGLQETVRQNPAKIVSKPAAADAIPMAKAKSQKSAKDFIAVTAKPKLAGPVLTV